MSIETIAITGRRRQSLRRKLTPLWWFLNDAEQRLDDGTTGWYMSGQPQWLRQVSWQLRNPLQKLRAFVLGAQDKNYTVTGKAPVMPPTADGGSLGIWGGSRPAFSAANGTGTDGGLRIAGAGLSDARDGCAGSGG